MHINLRWFLIPILTFSIIIIVSYYDFTADDSYITMRYAENFINHGTLVFNIGEPVNALTSPFHAVLESIVYRITGTTLTSYKLLSIFLLFCSYFLAARLFKNVFSQLIIASILMLSPCVILWTVGGLETPLLLTLITVLTVMVYKGIQDFKILCLFYVLVGLAFVIRFDSTPFTIPLTIYVSVKWLKDSGFTKLFLAALLGALIPIVWIVIGILYYGDLLPTSFYEKTPSTTFSISNLNYVFSYLVFTNLIPLTLSLFFFLLNKPSKLVKSFECHLKSVWWLYLSLLPLLIYSNTSVTKHMMFSFRLLVPYIPVFVIILADLYKNSTNQLQDTKREQHFTRFFILTLIVAICFQVYQAYYTYNNSLNGLWTSGEYGQLSLRSYTLDLLPTLESQAEDIKQHWQQQDQSISSTSPRINTFAAGILPYVYNDTYIYAKLISYRHDCPQADESTKMASNYIHVLNPRHGTIEEQLPKPINHYELVSSDIIEFNGNKENFMIFYDQSPAFHTLPAKINMPCK